MADPNFWQAPYYNMIIEDPNDTLNLIPVYIGNFILFLNIYLYF